MRNDKINAKLDEVLSATGLDKYVDKKRIVGVKEKEKIDIRAITQTIEKITNEVVDSGRIVLGQKADIINIDKTNPDSSFALDNEESLLFVDMTGGVTSQLYKMMMEVMADSNKALSLEPEDVLRRINGYNIYIYLPKAQMIDLDVEIREYERYVLEVLVKA
ncbi:MAG: hypothetical protein KJ864_03000 [Candidatus Omnitrophica bacterium]|nr:hypothetical protein [Candidatus Omnitrophota bacterium]